MKKIGVIGLGMMGASYADALKDHYDVYGYDKDRDTIIKALNKGIIKHEIDQHNLKDIDVMILCLYPKDNVDFIKKHQSFFKNDVMITDIAGTKEPMVDAMMPLLTKQMSYTSHHPMAGKEKSGFDYHDKNIFSNANFIIVKTDRTKERDVIFLESIAKIMQFRHVLVTDINTHDQLIAYTSQLTHIMAVALVLSNQQSLTKEATGDSYRDLTRIANINVALWTELFLENKQALIQAMDCFILKMTKIKESLVSNDEKTLGDYLKEAKEKRNLLD